MQEKTSFQALVTILNYETVLARQDTGRSGTYHTRNNRYYMRLTTRLNLLVTVASLPPANERYV